ncbi:MAG: dTDP-4-dehydrorhamnose reductase [Clostridia bacterium]|nr:dTDP-4-dehydrorhamnose reductase [Clostridia bacterium]
MKILITGANGMLAKAVIDEFKLNNELVLTDVKELDITDQEAVIKFIEKVKPNLVVNCAAYTAVDAAENNLELAEKINSEGPKNLAIASTKIGAVLAHISTDYVFDGNLNIQNSYSENNETFPVTAYGITKLHGEESVKDNCDKYYIFRTAWLYGDGKNFVKTMLNLGKEKESINVVNDQHGSPTYSVDLANIIRQVIEKKLPYGIYHSTNMEFTTWYDFTKEIFELANINCTVKPVSSEQFITVAKRPKNSQLSKEKLVSYGINIPSYHDALKRYLKKEV